MQFLSIDEMQKALNNEKYMRRIAELKAEELENIDPLTQLTNRRYFYEKISTILRTKFNKQYHYGILLIIDIDDFKRINDSLGHLAGDACLVAVSEFLLSGIVSLEGDVSLSRIGGDEFALLFGAMKGNYDEIKEKAMSVAQSILEKFTHKITLDSHDYMIQVSIGINLFSIHNTSIQDIISEADLALYEAKRLGKNNFHFFDSSLQKEIDFKLKILNEVQNKNMDNFLLYYQPIFNIEGEVVALETLIRWKDEDNMIVPASHFIGYIEMSASVVAFNMFIFEYACKQLSIWQKKKIKSSFSHLSINVSSTAFMDNTFHDFIIRTIEQYQINPHYIMLEITEHKILNNFNLVRENMNHLIEYGIGFSLDDFGTGYSSLSYIHKLPFSELKLDRAFLTNIKQELRGNNDEKFLLAVIAMAKVMQVTIVAEGIEDEYQKNTLDAFGCDLFQGYYLGKPTPPPDDLG